MKPGNIQQPTSSDGLLSPSLSPSEGERVAPRALARGTCSSLPVLQVAVGRRLGYPLKLVTTKGHQQASVLTIDTNVMGNQ